MNLPTQNSLALLAAALLSGTALAGTTIELNADASRPAANDMIRATVYSEASGKNPADLARQVNQDIAEALKVIKAKTGVTVKSGQQNTYPIYGQNQKIDSWRMHAELLLESKDVAAVSDLIGKLQQMRLALGNINQLPSPETRQKVEDDATRDAIRAFQARAAVVAEVFGKPYRIKQLSVQQNGSAPPMPMMRASAMSVAAAPAPMPIEAGESLITTSISGQIELAD
jgi:predicted secreted protein